MMLVVSLISTSVIVSTIFRCRGILSVRWKTSFRMISPYVSRVSDSYLNSTRFVATLVGLLGSRLIMVTIGNISSVNRRLAVMTVAVARMKCVECWVMRRTRHGRLSVILTVSVVWAVRLLAVLLSACVVQRLRVTEVMRNLVSRVGERGRLRGFVCRCTSFVRALMRRVSTFVVRVGVKWLVGLCDAVRFGLGGCDV